MAPHELYHEGLAESLAASGPFDPRDEEPGDRDQFWSCCACGAQNYVLDGECQFCECGGLDCKRDSCSAPEHFHAEHVTPEPSCELCRDGVPVPFNGHAPGCTCEGIDPREGCELEDCTCPVHQSQTEGTERAEG